MVQTLHKHELAFVVGYDSDLESHHARLSRIVRGAGPCAVLALVPESLREELSTDLLERHPGVIPVSVRSVSMTHVAQALAQRVEFRAFAFAGDRKPEGPLDLRWLPQAPLALTPWLPCITIRNDGLDQFSTPLLSWVATQELLKAIGEQIVSSSPADFHALSRSAESIDDRFGAVHWGSAMAAGAMQITETDEGENLRIRMRAQCHVPPRPLRNGMSVCAIIPHFQCEAYLHRAIRSLVQQSRRPDEIVVIHDGPEAPPIDIVRAFPGVTLMASVENVGPYCLVQSLINATRFDAYMLQDADDFSTVDRLSSTMDFGEQFQAELVGTQELRAFPEKERTVAFAYPIQAHLALAMRPVRPILHPSSLISRSLLEAIDGFSMGMRFTGDTEMHFRAFHVARLFNSPAFGYVRSIRQGSLTTARDTGIGSPARTKIWEQIETRYLRNQRAAHMGQKLELDPLAAAPDIGLVHLAGPKIL